MRSLLSLRASACPAVFPCPPVLMPWEGSGTCHGYLYKAMADFEWCSWLDLEGSVDKTISLIESAAQDGIQVLGFPEVW